MINFLKDMWKKINSDRPHDLEDGEVCPDCGTTDCHSHDWYRSHINVTGAGVVSIKSKYIAQSCKVRTSLRNYNRIC